MIEALEPRLLLTTVINVTKDTSNALILPSGTSSDTIVDLHGHKIGSIYGENVHDVTVKNGTVTGGKASNGISIYETKTGLANLRFDNLNVFGFSGYGLAVGTASKGTLANVTFTNIKTHDNKNAGLFTYGAKGTISSVTINHVDSYNNHDGILCSGVDGLVIEYCHAWNTADGIWVYNVNNAAIRYNESNNNKALNTDGLGFDLDGGTTNSVMEYNNSHDNEGYGYGLFQFSWAESLWYGNTLRYNTSTNDAVKQSASLSIWSDGSSKMKAAIYGNVFKTPHTKFVIIGDARQRATLSFSGNEWDKKLTEWWGY